MKKIFAMLLALVMVLSMVACQPSNAPTTPTDSSKPADNTSTPADPGTKQLHGSLLGFRA